MAVVNEAVAEVAEEVAEAATEVAEVSRSLSGRDLTIGLVIGGIIGGGATFLVLRKKLETKYNELAETEIDEMREHFRSRLAVREEKPDLGELAGKVEDLGYATPNPGTPVEKDSVLTEEVEKGSLDASDEADAQEDLARERAEELEESLEKNVFTEKDPDDEWDYEHENNMRRPDHPYVIHYDERNEKNYSEATFVYYTGDDVLCDARDNVVEDKEKIVGEENLTKFGHGSNDKNVVYVRNDVLAADFEIVKHDGDYAEVVHGFVKHSDEPRRRRRHFDDAD